MSRRFAATPFGGFVATCVATAWGFWQTGIGLQGVDFAELIGEKIRGDGGRGWG